MDNHKPAAQRIRPILEAMQRSIDSARRKRVHGSDGPPAPALSPAPAAMGSNPPGFRPAAPQNPRPLAPASDAGSPIFRSPPAILPDQTSSAVEGGQRLKARPKRLNAPLPAPFEQSAYRAQAS